jgi:hypothetical protein
MRKPERLPKETSEQRAAAAVPTPATLADSKAWAGSLSATKNAQGQNVTQGMKDAKEMLGAN